MEDRIENLLEAGVLDPAKVTRSGLMNACGIAGIMLTTQARRRAARSPMTRWRGGPAAAVARGTSAAVVVRGTTALRRKMTQRLLSSMLGRHAARRDRV